MKENNLLASVALFSELYNNDKYTNVGDILGEFIKAAIVTENQWTITSTELTLLLQKIYDFKIPESVIRTTVKNRLKNFMSVKDGHYNFNPIIKSDFEAFDDKYNHISEGQTRIILELQQYIIKQTNQAPSELDRETLIANLNNYLLDNGVNDKYSKFISAFVIKNQNNLSVINDLNLIREGIILYQGIRYTSDINELGKWNSELTIFLSTEHLFNSLGYNGLLYEQIFDDFYSLVAEINASSKNKNGEKLVKLKYLEETKEEVDQFFQVAELIQKGSLPLDTSKPAMKAILDGCKYPSDIKNKKINFETQLRKKGIALQEFTQSVYKYKDYVVEDEKILGELKKDSERRGKTFDENLCRQFFKIFTKINYYRGGESRNKFERIEAIFITANRFALYLAHDSRVKFVEDDIPFAKDIDYITSKFWFKLKKGFSIKDSFPKSLDVITKAQIVLSSQLNQTISHEYQKLQKELREGRLSKDEALERSYELRSKPNKPEEITVSSIDISLDFLNNESHFEDLFREKQKQADTLQEIKRVNEELKNELQRRDEIEKQKQNAQRDLEKKEYINSEWKNYRKSQWNDSFYSLGIIFIAVFPIIIGLFLKANSTLSKWMESLGNFQYAIWSFLVLILLVEWVGRAYLFNKDKIKNGWRWLTVFPQSSQYLEIMEKSFAKFEEDFNYKT